MYAFIHIPKTAGTTLRSIFRRSFGADHCDVKCPSRVRKSTPWLKAENVQWMKTLYPKLSGITGHRVCCFTDLDSTLPNLQYFTFLRDPKKRFISNFHHHYRGRMEQCTLSGLEKFVADANRRNVQTKWICGQEDSDLAIELLKNKVGCVGLTEKFDESLILLRQFLDKPKFDINYQSRNFSQGKAPLDYQHDKYINDLIQDANQADLAVYQYALEELFPKQIIKYGDDFNDDLNAFLRNQKTFKEPSEPLWGRVKRDLIYKPSLHLPWA